MTAHRYIEDNCHDLGMKVIHGLSADMEDLTTKRGREEEDAVAHDVYEPAPGCPPRPAKEYIPTLPSSEKRDGFDTVIVADLR